MKLNINTQAYTKLIPLGFTDDKVVLQEIIQNAGRAIAALYPNNAEGGEIRVTNDPNTGWVTISNNGEQIRDWEALFDIGTSNWCAEVSQKKKPFGIGNASLTITRGGVTIKSNNKVLTFDAKDLAEGKDIGEPTPTAPTNDNKTWFTFRIAPTTTSTVRELFFYLPKHIRYFVNNEEASWKAPLKSLPLPGVGTLNLYATLDQLVTVEGKFACTYQGFRTDLQGTAYSEALGFSIALDETQFQANIPSRSKIIHYELHEPAIRKVVYKALTVHASTQPKEVLLASYDVLKAIDALYLIDQFDEIPADRCFTPLSLEEIVMDEVPNNHNTRFNQDRRPVLKTGDYNHNHPLYKVEELRITEKTLHTYLTALRNQGSVCLDHGREIEEDAYPFLSLLQKAEDLGLPQGLQAEYLSSLKVYTCVQSAQPFYIVKAKDPYCYGRKFDLYINADNYVDEGPSLLHDCLLALDDYDYGNKTYRADNDANILHQALQSFKQTGQDTYELDFSEIFDNTIRNLSSASPDKFLPEVFRGRIFSLSVSEDGYATIKLNSPS